MKALTLLILVSFFSFSSFAQETPPDKEKEPTEKAKEEEVVEDVEETDEVITESEPDEIVEETLTPEGTKSFTLDADDAVLEEKVVVEETVVEESDVSETTTYHYNNYKKSDDIQTLAGKNSHHGGFGAVSFKATEFNNKDMIMVGFRGGWIINRAMGIGFEGYGIIPTAEYENIDPINSLLSRSVGGYGGMFIEPIILSNKVVHLTFPIAGGGGWLGYMVDWEQNYNYYPSDLIDEDVFWYVEPGAAIELNVARNFRINMGASYRFTEDLDLVNTSSSAFDAWNYFITLKFGRF